MLTELKYQIADRFFEPELDEAFEDGKKAGAEYAMRRIAFEMKLMKVKMTATEKKGFKKAIQIMEDMRKQVQRDLKFNPVIDYSTGELKEIQKL